MSSESSQEPAGPPPAGRIALTTAALVIVAIAAWLVGDMGLLGPTLRGDDLPEPPPADAAVVELGRTLHEEYCVTCHGLVGEGQRGWEEPLPDGTLRAPPHNSDGHTWRHGDRVLFRVVNNGGPVAESTGTESEMPAFGLVMTADDIRAVLAYVKTLWTPQQRAFQAAESESHPFP